MMYMGDNVNVDEQNAIEIKKINLNICIRSSTRY